jgi:uncharacterized membrane protein YkoI
MRPTTLLTITFMLALTGCNCCGMCGSDGDEKEMAVPLDKVPATVLAAAEQAVPGINVSKVTMEKEAGETSYEVTGTDPHGNPVEVEVEVDASGKVTGVEKDED